MKLSSLDALKSWPAAAAPVALIAILAAACNGADSSAPTPPTPATAATPVAIETPQSTATPEETAVPRELTGLTGWTNSAPFTISERVAAGEVVLVDFWTYTCVNCIRTLPFLRDWHDRYADAGLTIIGVHTPEFEFEKDRGNVLDAMQRFRIAYPVAQDNDSLTWDAFENRAWPTKYLFDSTGELVYTHLGEGEYEATEQAIRAALAASGADLSGIPPAGISAPQEDEEAFHLTGELYAGYGKVYGLGGAISIAPREYYQAPDRVVDYQDSEFHHIDKIYLQGPWLNERDAIVHARSTSGLEDYLYARVFARSGNAVFEHRGDDPVVVYVELDGEPLPPDGAGADIEYDDEGRSLVRVDESRLYRLFELREFGEHELVVKSNSDRFAVSTFTFGNYLEGP